MNAVEGEDAGENEGERQSDGGRRLLGGMATYGKKREISFNLREIFKKSPGDFFSSPGDFF